MARGGREQEVVDPLVAEVEREVTLNEVLMGREVEVCLRGEEFWNYGFAPMDTPDDQLKLTPLVFSTAIKQSLDELDETNQPLKQWYDRVDNYIRNTLDWTTEQKEEFWVEIRGRILQTLNNRLTRVFDGPREESAINQQWLDQRRSFEEDIRSLAQNFSLEYQDSL